MMVIVRRRTTNNRSSSALMESNETCVEFLQSLLAEDRTAILTDCCLQCSHILPHEEAKCLKWEKCR